MEYILPILFFAGISIAAGIVLTVAGKIFFVFVDKTVEELTPQLPGLNCGACGFASCERYAMAIVESGVAANQCKPGGAETAGKIGVVLGREIAAAEPDVAFVHCAGVCKDRYDYKGTQSCRASELYYNGKDNCRFGCTGLGDCVEVCPEKAISLKNGRAVVAYHMCNGCGLCVKSCPKKIISIQNAKHAVHVACCSKDSGKITSSVCANGCIGCNRCVKNCPKQAVTVKENLAVVNYDLCDNCGNCVGVCPKKCITMRRECDALVRETPS